MKRRLLFVDDERELLEGLRDALRRNRTRWEMEFVDDPVAALELLRTYPADVVVSDLRMPTMDGAQMLEQVRALQPGAVRIVLSGQSDADTSMRAMLVAHMALAKP